MEDLKIGVDESVEVEPDVSETPVEEPDVSEIPVEEDSEVVETT